MKAGDTWTTPSPARRVHKSILIEIYQYNDRKVLPPRPPLASTTTYDHTSSHMITFPESTQIFCSGLNGAQLALLHAATLGSVGNGGEGGCGGGGSSGGDGCGGGRPSAVTTRRRRRATRRRRRPRPLSCCVDACVCGEEAGKSGCSTSLWTHKLVSGCSCSYLDGSC